MSRRIVKSDTLVSIIASSAGALLSITLDSIIPLGLVATVVLLFYRHYNQNPFKLSEEKLRSLIHEAREIEERYRMKLERFQEIKERIERGEIRGDIGLLNLNIEHTKEVIKMARLKIKIVELVLAVKEEVKIFKKLFGENSFNKLVSNADELSREINKVLEREGISEINEEEVIQYLEMQIPLVFKKPEKHRAVETSEKVLEKEHEKKPYVSVENLWNLIEDGTVKHWLELFEKSFKESMKIKLPVGVRREKEGYKNLLKTLCVTNLDMNIIRKVVDDRVLVRIAELFNKLKNEKSIELEPQDSNLNYIEDTLQIISSDVDEKVEGDTKINIYKIDISELEQKPVEVERRVMKDPKTGKAVKIVFRIL